MNPVTVPFTITLACSLACFACFVSILIVCATGQKQNSQGLLVSLTRKGVSVASGLTAPIVTLQSNGAPFLNYQRTTWQDLPAALDRALPGLPVRVLYFNADYDVPFLDAARAIAIMRAQARRRS
jgi:Biopolymer transport protein ExbD/TolR